MRKIAIIAITLTSLACSKRVVPDSSIVTNNTSDSTVVTNVIRADTVYIKGDTVRVTERIDCDKVTNKPVESTIHAKSGRSSIAVTIGKDGKLTATAVCDSLMEVVQVMDKEIFRLRHEAKLEVRTPPTQYITRKIDIICRYVAGGLLLLLIGFVAAKLTKIGLPF